MTEEIYFENQYFAVSHLRAENAVFCRVKTSYVPMMDFQVAFNHIGELVEREKIGRMIFDKSNLITFHQPSMEWYHVHWKERMYQHGLKTYWKVLPKNDFFVQSVKIGRDKIRKNNPSFDFDKYDIRYFDRLEDALASEA
ncbi:MAG: hypothetical protein H7Z75_04935 [Ferruginibacter sp.]|nr:hypothetical protein [Cytophagales bacterium]